MGSNQTNVAKSSLSVQNTILQASSESCISDCTNISSGNTIIFNGSSIDGNVNFNQSCKATASCLMKQQLQSQVQNIMSAIASQSEKIEKTILSFNISSQVNASEINENIVNSITQVLQSACQATSENIRTGDLIVLENTTVGGNVSFGQGGDSVADCTLNNLARQVTFNKESAKQNQSQKVESVFAMIAIAVIIVVIIGAIIVFITLRGKSKSAPAAPTTPAAKSASSKKSGGLFKFLEKNPEVLA